VVTDVVPDASIGRPGGRGHGRRRDRM